MDLHKVRRVSWVLLASELRSGRSLSNPRSLLSPPVLLLLIDTAVFLVAYGIAATVLAHAGSLPADSGTRLIVVTVLGLLPAVAVGTVVIAGVMFEFSTTNRFSASDAVNWLPVTPGEYVLGSALAVAFVYSAGGAFVLGASLAVSLAYGLLPTFVLSGAFAVLALVEGGLLIEMLRSTLQRAGAAIAGKRGRVTFVLRAALFIIVILVIELAFNPVLLVGLLPSLTGVSAWAPAVPFLWPSEAIISFTSGGWATATLFTGLQAAFLGLLGYAAAWLRTRYWSPTASEVQMEAHPYGGGHPYLAALGLSPAESSLVAKDLIGLVRRRELLPILVMPLVLELLITAQTIPRGDPSGSQTVLSLWVVWIPGFFSLLLSITSFGQERRAVAALFVFPITARNLLRAKLAGSLLLPSLLAVVFGAGVEVYLRLPGPVVAGLALLAGAATLIGALVGLTVATRFADFTERPRAQFVRPGAMMAGLLGGVAVLFVIALPGLFWAFGPSPWTSGLLPRGGLSLGVAIVGIAGFFRLAQSGAERFFQELPT